MNISIIKFVYLKKKKKKIDVKRFRVIFGKAGKAAMCGAVKGDALLCLS